ncbi:hypothetical protein [Undibacterium flavidum]|uniref:Prevent-host-death family protein n=1 Tax=Undibacterium flavidum TaxID=2762297 RepID=A0ABR6Y6I6_9BURK|nr:hypothetical protein [Undibacterium flavidum]MBC3872223.1 hypothetical protein [Undibacterium flavidum]
MMITRLTSSEFIHHPNQARKAASNGPVFITDRECTTHDLLSIKEYQQLTNGQQKIAD